MARKTIARIDADAVAHNLARVREWAGVLPPGEWVRGGRWSTESWDDTTQPT